MSTLPKTYLTPEQYLEIERKEEYKNEYFNGQMLPMPRVGQAHCLIVGNTAGSLSRQLLRRPYYCFLSAMKVLVGATGLYTYPDVIVVSGEPRFQDPSYDDTLLNPTVIVEVLTDSTEAYDRGQKFEQYRSLESLAEYLMICSQRVSAERYTRQPSGSWSFDARASLEDSIDLKSVDCQLLLAEIYEKVDFFHSPPASRRW
jgi:Uma2 family endonuclease